MPGFSIKITAIDGASARIDAVNRRLAAMRAPAERLQKSLSTFSRLSGIQKVGEGFARIGRTAYGAFQSVARIVAPLGVITGAASLAGMYRLVEAWSQWGTQLGFAATRLGISASALQTFQGAATLAGGSADGMTTGLQALGQGMYDAIGGRAPATVALFNQLGIAFDDGTRHARSVTAVLPELADKIASIRDPFTQARVASQLFGGAAEQMLPFLRLGSRGIADLNAMAARYGVTTDAGVAAANRFRMAQVGLTLAVQGLGNSISERLSPILSPLLDQMGLWIAANRNLIANWIGDHVRMLVDYLKQVDFAGILRGLESTAKTVDGVARAFGGWKVVLEGILALKFAGFLTSLLGGINPVTAAVLSLTAAYIANSNAYDDFIQKRKGFKAADRAHEDLQERVARLSPEKRAEYYRLHARNNGGVDGSQSSNPIDVQRRAAALPTGIGAGAAVQAFRSLGWSPAQAAGLAANLYAESKLDPHEVGDSGSAYGIGQWHADRQKYFRALFGHDIHKSTLGEQLQFVNEELHSTESSAGNLLRKTSSAYDAGAVVSRFYERPRAADEAADNRGRLADQIAATSGAAGPDGTAKVHITVAGAGVDKVVARTSGNMGPPKVMTSQVGTSSGV